jgi:hypothetical protein
MIVVADFTRKAKEIVTVFVIQKKIPCSIPLEKT